MEQNEEMAPFCAWYRADSSMSAMLIDLRMAGRKSKALSLHRGVSRRQRSGSTEVQLRSGVDASAASRLACACMHAGVAAVACELSCTTLHALQRAVELAGRVG